MNGAARPTPSTPRIVFDLRMPRGRGVSLGPDEREIWSGAPRRHRLIRCQERTAGVYVALGAAHGCVVSESLGSPYGGIHGLPLPVTLAAFAVPWIVLLFLGEWLIHRTVRYRVTDQRVIVTWGAPWVRPISRSTSARPRSTTRSNRDSESMSQMNGKDCVALATAPSDRNGSLLARRTARRDRTDVPAGRRRLRRGLRRNGRWTDNGLHVPTVLRHIRRR